MNSLLYIIAWTPVCLEIYVITKMCMHKEWKEQRGRLTLLIWVVAMTLTIYNTIQMCVLLEG